MNTALLFQIQSTLILLILYVGVFKRKDRSLHPKLMLGAIIWDILLILQIELTRGAVAKAVKVSTNPTLLNWHVSIAIFTVLTYFGLIYFGRQLLKGNNQNRFYHKLLGIICMLCRTFTYITSYFVASP